MSGSVVITGSDAQEPAGSRTLGPLEITGSAAVGATAVQPIAQGDNTILVPPGAVGAVIIPPFNDTAVLKLRTSANNTDGGLPVSPTLPTVYPFPPTPPTSLIVNATAAQTGLLNVWFW